MINISSNVCKRGHYNVSFSIKRHCGADPRSFIIQFNDISSDHSILFHLGYVQVWTIQAMY